MGLAQITYLEDQQEAALPLMPMLHWLERIGYESFYWTALSIVSLRRD